MTDKETIRQRNRAQYLKHRERRIAEAKAYYEANKERIQAARVARRQANLEDYRARDRARYHADPDRRRESNRRWHERNPHKAQANSHGLSAEQFTAMLQAQHHICALCDASFANRRPYIDHDHQTGEVRGLLCMNCNTALGHFRDDPYLMRRAADYVQWRPLKEAA